MTIFSFGCIDLKPEDNNGAPIDNIIIFSTSDFNTAFINVFSKTDFKAYTDLAPISSDHHIYTYQNNIYILNRFGSDNIEKISILENYQIAYEESLENYSNPHSMVFLNENTALVSLYGKDYLITVSLAEGKIMESLPFSHLNDMDGLPEFGPMRAVGNNIFLISQQLNRNTSPWEPASRTIMTIIDKNNLSSSVDKEIPCANPDTRIREFGGILYFGCPGKWGLTDGRLLSYEISIDSFQTILTENDIEGNLGLSGFDITDLIVIDHQEFFITGYTDTFTKSLAIHYKAGSFSILADTTDGYFSSIEKDAQYIYLADRKISNPGIHIFNTSDYSKRAFISTDLPPYGISIPQ